jgi:hypothetical protein
MKENDPRLGSLIHLSKTDGLDVLRSPEHSAEKKEQRTESMQDCKSSDTPNRENTGHARKGGKGQSTSATWKRVNSTSEGGASPSTYSKRTSTKNLQVNPPRHHREAACKVRGYHGLSLQEIFGTRK